MKYSDERVPTYTAVLDPLTSCSVRPASSKAERTTFRRGRGERKRNGGGKKRGSRIESGERRRIGGEKGEEHTMVSFFQKHAMAGVHVSGLLRSELKEFSVKPIDVPLQLSKLPLSPLSLLSPLSSLLSR
jgi:hypothetical protein